MVVMSSYIGQQGSSSRWATLQSLDLDTETFNSYQQDLNYIKRHTLAQRLVCMYRYTSRYLMHKTLNKVIL